MTGSYEQFDKPYRRGLVLGLSLAELFLILLFLLLLLAIGITSLVEEELEKANKSASEFQDQLSAIYEVVGEEITIEDFTQLAKYAGEKKSLENQIQELRDKLKNTEKRLSSLNDLENVAEEYNLSPSDITELIENKKETSELLKEKTKIQNQLDTLLKNEQRLKAELNQKQFEIDVIKENLQIAGNKIDEQQLILDSFSKLGQDPPCWFILVDDKSNPGQKRQKHIKIFDVKISDNTFNVRYQDNTNIIAVDMGNTENLPLVSGEYLNKELTKSEFIDAFNVFYIAGKNKKIRDYSCRFMVDVYDTTSSNNKIGYKRNLRVVENIFYKFEEKESWNPQ